MHVFSSQNPQDPTVGTADDSLPYVPVLRPRLPTADRILAYMQRIDSARIYTNRGPLVQELEGRLESHLGLPVGGIATASSGTSGIVGAILASAGRATAERPYALMPSYTFVATAVAAEQCGYRPYILDVDPQTWMLAPERLAGHEVLARAGVVLPVSAYGRPVPLPPWQAFQDATGVPVVVDGAASFDRIIGAPEGFIGTIPVAFSLHATKAFGVGEGGAVASHDVGLILRTVQALNFGFHGARDCRIPSINGKLSEYHAAVGLAEDDGWPAKSRDLQRVVDSYRRLLGDRFHGAPDIGLSYGLLLCRTVAEVTSVLKSFETAEIGSRHWYGEGLHRQTLYTGAARDTLAVTDDLAPRLIGLPMAPDLAEADIARVAAAVIEGLGRAVPA